MVCLVIVVDSRSASAKRAGPLESGRYGAGADYRRITALCPIASGVPVRCKRLHFEHGARRSVSATSLPARSEGEFFSWERAGTGTELAGAFGTVRARL